MKILVTNDDGINAKGLQTLAEVLKKVGEIAIVAPDRERSAVGHALTLHHPLGPRKSVPTVLQLTALRQTVSTWVFTT